MNDYMEVRLDMEPCSEDMTDLMAGYLADAGFESFVADTEGLTAYIAEKAYSEAALRGALAEFPFEARITTRVSRVEGRDWNAEWERNYFKPIVVGERCVIHSTFHTDVPAAEYDIVIDPKMAFGTGHHATTSLMIERLLEADLRGKRVTDVGTGSGILAILATMRGGAEVTGIEIDEAAYTNALENVALNGVESTVRIIHGDAEALAGVTPADLLLANINRNIITADIHRYAAAMAPGATAAFSGFYVEDVAIIRAAAQEAGLRYTDTRERDRWACAAFVRDAY